MTAHESVDLLVLSPHLDDAVLSCGGSIARATRGGGRALVATLFAGAPKGALPPLALDLHATWGLDAEPARALASRRREDHEALAHLGAEALHLELVDALYRWRDGEPPAPAYPTLSSLFRPGRREPGLHDDVLAALAALPQAERVFAPLAAGGHVDHRVVRAAAVEVYGEHPGLSFYEDYPYAARPLAVARALRRGARRSDWNAEVEPLDEETLEARIEAILCYRSQLGTVFFGDEHLRRRIRRFVRRRGGERRWRAVQRLAAK